MQKRTQREAEKHAIAQFPHEACGVIVRVKRTERYFPCRNTATNPGDCFVMHPDDFAAAEDEGTVVAVVHSHPNATSEPSELDRVQCEVLGMPSYIVALRTDLPGPFVPEIVDWRRIDPEGYAAPLIGREFHHGSLDCYGLIRDWFARERGVELRDFPRADKWWEGDEELYLGNFRLAGFEPVADGQPLKAGDVILMQHQSKRVNHAGVFIDAELPKEHAGLHRMGGCMLHHLYGRPSQREVYGGYWREITRVVVRHETERSNDES